MAEQLRSQSLNMMYIDCDSYRLNQFDFGYSISRCGMGYFFSVNSFDFSIFVS